VALLTAAKYLLCTAWRLALLQNRALRTNATTQQVLQVAVEDCGYEHRSTGVPQVLLQHHQVENEQQRSSSSSCAKKQK
jgi:hypothetical protein